MNPPHPSLWHLGQPTPKDSSPTLPAATQVVVVGAGISGLTAALALARAQRQVCVIDMAAGVARGDTGQTTAHLTQIMDAGYSQISHDFGDAAGTFVARSHGDALDAIEATVEEYKIDCQFERVPAYLYAEKGQDSKAVVQERKAMRRVQLAATRPKAVPLPFAVGEALTLPEQAQFDPRAYVEGLRRAFESCGGVVCLDVRMQKVSAANTKKGALEVQTSHGTLEAEEVIYATHTPPTMLTLQTKISPQRSYALAVRCQNPPPRGLYYDAAEPYHYLRTQPSEHGDLLIVGGCDHRAGDKVDTEQAYAELEAYTRERFAVEEVVASWSGIVYEPADGVPFIGKVPGEDHIWMIAGLSGHGLSSGTLGGLLCADHILGKASKDADVYAPSRFKPLAQASESLHHILQTSKHMVKDRITGLFNREEVTAESGAIVRDGTRVAAIYNDGHKLHVLSAVCPHAGCYVQWNSAEKSWDCPCHGSRFHCKGRLLSGPATSDLKTLATKASQ